MASLPEDVLAAQDIHDGITELSKSVGGRDRETEAHKDIENPAITCGEERINYIK